MITDEARINAWLDGTNMSDAPIPGKGRVHSGKGKLPSQNLYKVDPFTEESPEGAFSDDDFPDVNTSGLKIIGPQKK